MVIRFGRSALGALLVGVALWGGSMPSSAADIALVTEEDGLQSIETRTAADGTARVLSGPVPMTGHDWAWIGSRLAYTTEAGGQPGLHVVDMASGVDALISGLVRPVSIRWAPNCRHVGFATYDPDAMVGRIYVADSQGGEPVLASGEVNPGLAADYAFSHDSRYLAFGVRSPAAATERGCAVTDLTTGRVQQFPGINARQWLWSPADTQLALRGTTAGSDTNQLFLIDFKDGAATMPVRVNRVREGIAADVLAFEWSPTGEYVTFRTELEPGAGRLFLVSAATKRWVMVKGTANVVNYAWSPDGRSYFVKDADAEAPPGMERLRIGQMTQVLSGDTWLVPDSLGAARLAWSPDCQSLAFVKERALYIIDLADREPVMVTDRVNIEAITWVPQGGAIVAVVASRQKTSLALVLIVPKPGAGQSTVRQISGDFRCPVSIDWSPDGSGLLTLAHHTVDAAKALLFVPGGANAEWVELDLADSVVSASWYPRPRP
jgi:Tol biopolymer transport system component